MKKPFNPITLIAWITAALVLGIALAAIAISFSNLFALAYANRFGVTAANLWAWVVDGLILVTTLEVLRAKLQREDARYAWFLVGFATLTSVIFNVWHAQSVFEGFMRGLPPLVFFLTFELLMRQVQAFVSRRAVVLSVAELSTQATQLEQTILDKTAELDQVIIDKTAELDRQITSRTTKLTELQTEIKAARTEKKTVETELSHARTELETVQTEKPALDIPTQTRQDKIARRREIVAQLLTEDLPLDKIAENVGASVKTIERDVVALEAHKNGVTS